jgi:membrane protease YdiL (CAAX protease family)
MPHQKLAILFAALFLFMIAWSVGLAAPLIGWLDPEGDMGHYFINKGVLTLVMALVFWRLKLFTAIGFGPGMGSAASWASFGIGLPLFALGVMAFFEPGRAAVSTFDLAGWAVVVLFVAFTEETLLRGVLWQALGGTSLWRRAIITSVMFGSIHLIPAGLGDFGWAMAAVYGLSAVGFGMIFAAMRECAGTIWSVIIVHAVFDFAAISAAGDVDTLLDPGLETYVRFLSAAVVFAAWGSGAIYLIGRRARREGVEHVPAVRQAIHPL